MYFEMDSSPTLALLRARTAGIVLPARPLRRYSQLGPKFTSELRRSKKRRPKLRHLFHEVAQRCLMFHFQNRASGAFATP
jgi:hypothetical protein